MENIVENVETTKLYDDFKAQYAGDWLESVRRLGMDVDLLHDIIRDERDMMDGLKGIDYSHLPANSTNDMFAVAMERLEHSIADYAASLSELLEARQEAYTAINAIPDNLQRVILMRRYLRNETYSIIEDELAYSHEWIMKQRHAGLVAVFEHMPSHVRVNLPRAF